MSTHSTTRPLAHSANVTSYNPKAVFWLCCMGMLVFGIAMTTLGTILPDVITRFGVDKAAAASLFLTLSFGIMAGSLVFGPAVDRLGYRVPLALATVLVSAGIETVAFGSSFGWLRAGVLGIGFGGGVLNGGANALVADISLDNKAAGLSLIGVFFGIGAVGVPFVLGSLSGRASYGTLLSGAGAVALVPLIVTLLIRFPPPKHAQSFPVSAALQLVRQPTLLMLGFMLFLESGMEITMGGWSASYAREELALDARTALYFLSLYWLGMMSARLAMGRLLGRMSHGRALVLSLCTAFVGTIVLLAARAAALSAIGIFLVGAGFAAVFPIVLGWVGERYAALSGTAFSIALVMALTGGMLLPYVTGVLGGRYGLRTSLLVVPIALVFSFLTFTQLRARRLHEAQPQTTLP